MSHSETTSKLALYFASYDSSSPCFQLIPAHTVQPSVTGRSFAHVTYRYRPSNMPRSSNRVASTMHSPVHRPILFTSVVTHSGLLAVHLVSPTSHPNLKNTDPDQAPRHPHMHALSLLDRAVLRFILCPINTAVERHTTNHHTQAST
jgi:hypothetical protein